MDYFVKAKAANRSWDVRHESFAVERNGHKSTECRHQNNIPSELD